jgi:ribonuclease HI
VASMSYSHSTITNNMAEYCGLLHGLRYAHDHQCQPLHVVGDSSMIIRQQTLHVPPKKARLALLYHKTKRYANAMRISSWAHHFRAYNKWLAWPRIMPWIESCHRNTHSPRHELKDTRSNSTWKTT